MFKMLWEDEEGLTTVEYALLLALVAIAAITAWTTLGTTQTSASGLGLLLDTNPLTGQAFYRTVYP